MDALQQDSLEDSRRETLEEKARQTMDLAEAGFRLKEISLRQRYPHETAEQLGERFRLWLASDD
jgi:hypothetical protein